jgi:hypothetical protein
VLSPSHGILSCIAADALLNRGKLTQDEVMVVEETLSVGLRHMQDRLAPVAQVIVQQPDLA